MERFENALFKQRKEINDSIEEMFMLLKELTTSMASEKKKMWKLLSRLNLYLDHLDIDLSEYLSQAITTEIDAGISKTTGPPKKRYCNDFSMDEMVDWVEIKVEQNDKGKDTTEGVKVRTSTTDKGKEKVSQDAIDGVEARTSTIDMNYDSEFDSADDSDYHSYKSVDYLSLDEEELIELRNRMKDNREAKAKVKGNPISKINEPNDENSMSANNVRGETFEEHDIYINELLTKLKTTDEDGITEYPFIYVGTKYVTVDQFKECLTYCALANGFSLLYERSSGKKVVAKCGQRPPRFYVCFAGLAHGWKAGCEKIIALDGCFLKIPNQVIPAGGNPFEVRSESEGFTVDEGKRTCSCRMWYLSGIPCVHAIKVIFLINMVLESYVPAWFKTDMYFVAYHNFLKPVPGRPRKKKAVINLEDGDVHVHVRGIVRDENAGRSKGGAGDVNLIRTLRDYSRPSREGFRNTVQPTEGNNVVPIRSNTIWLVQNGCSFYELRSEDPNQHLKDFLKLVDSLDLDGANRERTRMCLFQFSLRDQARNWLERLPAGSISTWEDLTTLSRLEYGITLAAHTERMERFENALFIQRNEINDRIEEMFMLLKELTTSMAPEKVLIREETKYHVTKNINYISLTRIEEEKNDEYDGHVYEAILKKNIIRKEDIRGNFEIPCNMGGLKHMNALVDQGFDVNIIPLSTYMKLADERPTETDIRLSLASHSYICPLGIAENVLFDVAGYVYHVDFVILDIREDEKRPFILGTPFLIMAKAMIKFDKGTITLRSGKSKISFHRIPESLGIVEKGIKNDIEPIAPTMTVNGLVLE
uniref:MAK10-like protein n=1 Tax=Tanacetum cinerariifolium TaxID=118510 RepID=A0A6L2LW77_TANCI|nr:MAK10-like protein [Tanacetum cinerariifolium]